MGTTKSTEELLLHRILSEHEFVVFVRCLQWFQCHPVHQVCTSFMPQCSDTQTGALGGIGSIEGTPNTTKSNYNFVKIIAELRWWHNRTDLETVPTPSMAQASYAVTRALSLQIWAETTSWK